jgi:hypothetical protein
MAMLVGRYATYTEEIDIEGDFDGLLKLAKAISGARDAEEISLPSLDPGPYDGCFKLVRIKRDNRQEIPVEIRRDGDELNIRGSAQKLEILAYNIRFLITQGVDPNSTVQNHIHEEYYEGHPYLSPDSAALTISFISSVDR